MSVVDAQGWGLSEEFVPREEKTELLRALHLCGPGGPHVVLLVIPLLDFTEPEARAVERRMEVLTSTVWRHTMVLFTCGDRLRARGRSVEDHIQSGGPALIRLMKKCRYRYHVFDNKTVVIGKRERVKQEVTGAGKKQERTWLKKTDKGVGRKSTGGEADGRKEGEEKQVRELLSKVENMLQENGGWHFSLHMYQRLEEEWSRREQELRVRPDAETSVGSVRRKQKTAETEMESVQEQRFETEEEEEEQEDSLRKEQENKENCVERKMNINQGRGAKIELKNLCSEKDGWETSSDCGGALEDSTGVNSGMMVLCCPNGAQLHAHNACFQSS